MIAAGAAMHQTRYPFVAITAAHTNSASALGENGYSGGAAGDSWASGDEENVDR
jgi:hypothetical protein